MNENTSIITKLPDLDITSDNPWKDDKLNRKELCESLRQIFDHYPEDQSLTIAIDGDWGTGKTTFLRMLKAYLEQKGQDGKKYLCLSFNAWECDHFADPIIPFVAELQKCLKNNADSLIQCTENLGNTSDKREEIIKRLNLIVGNIAPFGFKMAARFITGMVIEPSEMNGLIKSIADDATEYATKEVEKYIQQEKEKEELKKLLLEIRNIITGNECFNDKIIFFIDELDRCRPTFAIELLERIKHVLNSEAFIFVFGVNRTQLAKAVSGQYGPDFDGDRYLDKFFDVRLPIINENTFEFVFYCWERLNLEWLWGNSSFESMIRLFFKCSAVYGLSLRTISNCISQLKIALYFVYKKEGFYFLAMALSLTCAIKYSDNNLYNKITLKIIDYDDFKHLINSSSHGKGERYIIQGVIFLFFLCFDEDDFQAKMGVFIKYHPEISKDVINNLKKTISDSYINHEQARIRYVQCINLL